MTQTRRDNVCTVKPGLYKKFVISRITQRNKLVEIGGELIMEKIIEKGQGSYIINISSSSCRDEQIGI